MHFYRVAAILEKQKAKDVALAELGKQREHQADVRSLKHQLDLEDKRDKVMATASKTRLSEC